MYLTGVNKMNAGQMFTILRQWQWGNKTIASMPVT